MNERSFSGPVVLFDRVTFAYERADEIFRGVSFQVQAGEFCFISGESGAGKSTLLKLLYGANKNYLGSVRVFGEEISALNAYKLAKLRRRIGVIFQEFYLLEHLSVVDNVAVPLILSGKSVTQARARAQEILSWLKLGSYLYKMPEVLSGGQRQRVAAARAVASNADIIIADEPTGHVDNENVALLMRLLKELNRRGKTIFMATHAREILDVYPGRILELKDGSLKDFGWSAYPHLTHKEDL